MAVVTVRLVSTVAVGVVLSAVAVLGLTALSQVTRAQLRPETLGANDVSREGRRPVGTRLPTAAPRSLRPARAARPGTRSIGTAVATHWRGLGAEAEPLTAYGRLVRNLDALVTSTFGGREVCLRFATNELSPSACRVPADGRARYEVTFAGAARSSFRLSGAGTTIRLLNDTSPLMIGGRYITCGTGRVLTASAKWTLACVRRPASRAESGG